MENKFHEWRLTHWDIKKHKFIIHHMSAYGMTRVVTDRLAAYEELGFTPQQLEEIIKELNKYHTRYRVKDEFIDGWYGNASSDEIEHDQARGFSYAELVDLSDAWSISLYDLLQQVEEIGWT